MGESPADMSAAERWNRFWFQPAPVEKIAAVRGAIALLTAVYFLSALLDAPFWYASGGPQSASRVASFLVTAGLQQEARWILSPLFLSESVVLYGAYLLLGVGLSLAVAAGKGGRTAGWLLWLVFVGWANRSMLLAGLSDTLLSLALFGLAIAPPAPAWVAWRNAAPRRLHWSNGFAQRLLAVQVTLVGLATSATMLARPIWWNGLGALALAAPAEDRTIDWAGSALAQPLVHDLLTHFLVLALPAGLAMAWNRSTAAAGRATLALWCLAVALLGSFWLYAAVFAALTFTIASPSAVRQSISWPARQRRAPWQRAPAGAGG